ncbi:MAG: Gldg family protein [Myxococcota bacterium]
MAKPSKLTGGLYVTAIVAATLVIAVLVNVLSANVFARVDLTDHDLNTLSAASEEAVRDLDGLEVTLYISPDLPETIQDESGRERVMRDVAQKFRDKIEEYQSYSDGGVTVRRVTDDVVDKAKKAKLRVFSGEEATAKEGRLAFKEYALGATFHYKGAMEVLPLALHPEHYEFEITKRLLRLKDKVEHAREMKDVLAAGEDIDEAARSCDAAVTDVEPEGEGGDSPLGLMSAEASEARLAGYRSALDSLERACAPVETALAEARPLEGRNDALDDLLGVTERFAETWTAFRDALKSPAEPQPQQARPGPVGLARQLHALASEVEAEAQQVEDSPGRKRIGFVCAARAFCPFPGDEPLVPPQLEGVMGQKNPMAGQIAGQLKQMQQRVDGILSNIQRNLFERRGFEIVKVDLSEEIPDDVAGLVLFGPSADLEDWQLWRIDQFVMGGGSLVVFLDGWDVRLMNLSPGGEMNVTELARTASNAEDLLAHYGLKPRGDLVAEPSSHDVITVLSLIEQGQLTWQSQREFPYPLLPIFRRFADDSPLVRALPALTLPFTGSLEVADAEGREVTPLVESTPEAASLTDEDLPLQPEALLSRTQEAEADGPLVVAASATGTFTSYFVGDDVPEPPGDGGEEEEEEETASTNPERLDEGRGRVLVVGSNLGLEDLSRETLFEGFDLADLTGQGAGMEVVEKFRGWAANLQNWELRLNQIQHTLPDNIQFLFNALDWSIQKEALVEIRSKQYRRRPLKQLDEGTQSTVRVAAVALAPLLFMLFGVIAWMRRRARKRRLHV